jgi:dTMP kinase
MYLREILLHQKNHALNSQAELLLYMADRAQHVTQIIRPALEQGHIVLVDRFIDSTIAYQGYGRNLDLKLIKKLNTFVTSGVWPQLTFLLDIPVEKGLERARARNMSQKKTIQEGRFEAEALCFHQRLRQGYLHLAAQEPERIMIVQANDSIESVFQTIRQTIQKQLVKKTHRK